MLKIGIIGLPNVGKSTLFNALSNQNVEMANYPFATIEPNHSIIDYKDEKLIELSNIFKSKKNIFGKVEFIDIAGLVKGASKGEGLGNKFLSNIREVDAIIHVTRLFEDKDVIHVENKIDPIKDIETVETELIISDVDQLNKWLDRNNKKIETTKDTNMIKVKNVVIKILSKLDDLIIKDFDISLDEYKLIKEFNLLTLKPKIYLANISEKNINNYNKQIQNFIDILKSRNDKYVIGSIKVEQEISTLDDENKELFLEEIGTKETIINRVIKILFEKLNICSFYTVGPKEAHAWFFKRGMLAPQVAGIIHTDFERGFIKAEVYKSQDIFKYKNENILKEKGLIDIKGKDYMVEDGDICNFRFNV